MRTSHGGPSQPRDPDFVAAEAALDRAAKKARRRAIETTGSFPVFKDGKIVYYTVEDLARIDPDWDTAG